MNFLIIYSTPLHENLNEIHTQIETYEQYIRINDSTWLINHKDSATTIKNKLSGNMGIRDSILVFELTKKWATANFIDVSDWLRLNEDNEKS